MKLYIVGMLCVTVAACAPVIPIPVPLSGGPPKLPTDVMDAAALTPRDGAGAIVVIRAKVLRDMSCTYDISLDGRGVAGLHRGEQVTFYADPGPRIVGVVVRPEEDCEPALAEVPLQVVASATTKIVVLADHRYDLKVEATTY